MVQGESISLLRRLTAFVSTAAFALQPIFAFANPQGGVVSGGAATINESGPKLDIFQQSDKAIIDWRGFNIDENEWTEFHQPSSSSIALNRVNSNSASFINGKLSANGNIVILNQNGIMFGQGARVDVSGLVATTANISNDAFMNSTGKMNFNQPGNPDAKIVNDGQITAKDAGLVGLVAPSVINNGVITARVGRVHLASGDTVTVDFYGDNLMEVAVSDNVKNQLVENAGTINAAGGKIGITAAAGKNVVSSLINVKGELKAPAVAQRNGEIKIFAASNKSSGGSKVKITGKLDVSGRAVGEKGGKISVTADHVALDEAAVLDASGDIGGGNINIGGDFQGKGDMQRAIDTSVGANVKLFADALTNGNGGRIIVWSDTQTDFSGYASAKGGAFGGDGGLIETSGKRYLNFTGLVEANAAHGNAGTWLLDPADIVISTGANTNNTGNPNFVPNGTASVVNTTTIQTALNAGTNVTITTSNDGYAGNGDITVSNTITTSGAGNLTLSAYRNITVNAAITLAGGVLTLGSANSGNNIGSITISSSLTSGGGNIYLGGGLDPTTGYAVGGSTSNNQFGIYLNAATIDAGAGNITMHGQGGTYSSGTNYGIYATGVNVLKSSGTTNLYGTGGGGGSTGSNYGIYIYTGNFTVTNVSSLNLIGTGGTGSGGSNHGVSLYSITSAGSGAINITGTAGTGGSGNYSVVTSGTTIGGASYTGHLTYSGYDVMLSALSQVSSASNLTFSVTHDLQTGSITSGGGTLNISAPNNVIVNGAITSNGADIIIGSDSDANQTGYVYINGNLTSGGGNIYIGGGADATTGYAYGSNANTYQYGINIGTTTIDAGAGNIVMHGQGGAYSGGSNHGIYFSQGITTFKSSGTTSLYGTGGGGGTTGSNYGVNIYTGNFTTTNVSSFNVYGTGGTGSGGSNYGVSIYGINTTGSGAINLNGTSGSGGSTNYGIYHNGAIIGSATYTGNINLIGTDIMLTNTLRTSGTGTITLSAATNITTGTLTTAGGQILVGSDSDANNTGWINVNGSLTSGGGNIYLGGGADPTTGYAYSAGTANNQYGIQIGAVTIDAGAGNITMHGRGGNYARNAGIYQSGSATLKATTANLYAVGGAGTDNNWGLVIDSGTLTVTNVGTLNIYGTGGSGSGGSNYGMYVYAHNITSTGSGAINLIGTSGSGGTGNYSIYSTGGTIGGASYTGALGLSGTDIILNGTLRVSGAGTISLVATNSIQTGTITTGGTNIVVNSDSDADSAGWIYVNGNLTSNGGNIYLGGGVDPTTGYAYGPSTAANQYGIQIGAVTIDAGAGNITMHGHGGTVNNNAGIYQSGSATLKATTANLYGVGGTGTSNNWGIALDSNTLTVTNVGTLNLYGTGGTGASGSNYGIYIYAHSITSTGSGAINMSGTGGSGGSNNYSIYSTAGTIGGASYTGNLSLTGADIILNGTLRTSSTGTIMLTATNNIQTGTITTGSGNLTLSAVNNITVSGTLTTGSGNITVGADSDGNGVGNIVISGAMTSTSGNMYFGGGADPTTGYVYGTSSSGTQYGIDIGNYTINAGAGNITMHGQGGTYATGDNFGIRIGGTLITTSGAINLYGTGGTGGTNNDGIHAGQHGVYNAQVQSTSGAINLTGIGGSGTGGGHDGIYLSTYYTSGIYSLGSSNITLTGTAGSGGTSNYGIYAHAGKLGGAANTGNILVTSQNDIYWDNTNGTIRTGGSGTIAFSSANNITLTQASFTTGGADILIGSDSDANLSGNITITGTITVSGGDIYLGGGLNPKTDYAYGGSTSGNQYGINISSYMATISSGSRNIIMHGHGGTYSGGTNYGIALGYLQTTSGIMNLYGIGGDGGANNIGIIAGLHNVYTADVQSATGQINFYGTGGTGAGGSQSGIYISSYYTNGIYSTSTATITLNGTAGTGGTGNYGIQTQTNKIGGSSSAGNISLISQGDVLLNLNSLGYLRTSSTGTLSVTSTGSIVVTNGAVTTAGGAITLNADSDANSTGYISFDGTMTSNGGNIVFGGGADPTTGYAYGSNVNNSQYGIFITGTTSTIDAGSGNITMHGQGGADTTDGFNHGIYILPGATLTIATTGTANLYGIGGGGGTSANNMGINFGKVSSGAGIIAFNTAGTLNLYGTGGSGSGGSNNGIATVAYASGITSTGSGAINLTGIAGTGGTNYGISTTVGSGTGNLIGGTSYTGTLTLIADTVSLAGAIKTNTTTGTVWFKPYSTNTTIGIAGGSGTLQLTSAILTNTTTSNLIIGRTDGTGTITASAMTLAANTTIQNGASGTVSLGNVNGAYNFTVNTGTLSGTSVFGGTTAPSAVSLTFDSGAPVISGSMASLTKAGAGTLTLGGTLTLSSNLTISAGVVSQNGSNLSVAGTFSNDGTLRLNGNETLTLTGGMDADSGTVEYVGTSGPYTIKDFGATDYYNLLINGSGQTFSLIGGGGNVNVNGTVTVNAGTLSVGNTNFYISKGLTIASGASYVSAAGWTTNFNGNGTITDNNATKVNLGYISTSNNATVTLGSAIKADSLTIASGSTFSLNGNNFTRNTSGTVSNSGTFRLQGGETLTNVTNLGTSAGTVEYVGDGDGIADTFTIKDFGTTDYYNLTINSTDGTLDTFALGNALTFGSGGAFTMTNGTYDFGSQTITSNGNWTYTAGTVNAGTSTVAFTRNATVITGSHSLYNVLFNSGQGGNISMTVAGGTTLTTLGTLTFGNAAGGAMTINTGTIAAQGDITVTNNADYSGTGTLLINGTGNQTFTGSASQTGGGIPNVNINKASGTLTLAGTLRTYKDWTYTAGTLDAGTSTIVFAPLTNTITGSHSLYNVLFNSNQGGNTSITIAGGTTLTTLGTLTFDNSSSGATSVNTGTLAAQGNIVIADTNTYGGTATILINGTGNQTITSSQTTTGTVGIITVDKASGNLDFVGNVRSGSLFTLTNGTVNQTTGTFVAAGFTQTGGTFNGGSGNIGLNGAFNQSGGAFTSTSGNLTLNAVNFTISGGTFAHNNGTVTFTDTTGAATRSIDVNSSVDFYNLTYTGGFGNTNVTNLFNVASGDKLVVVNDFTIQRNTGTSYIRAGGMIEVQGNLIIGTGATGYTQGATTSTITLNGTGNQTITGTAGTSVDRITVNKASGTLSLVGSIGLMSNWTHTAGTMDAGTSTVTFINNNGITNSHTFAQAFNDVVISLQASGGGSGGFTINSGTLQAQNLTITPGSGGNSLTGAIEVQKNLTSTNGGNGLAGSASITLTGSNNQTINVAVMPTGTFTVNKTGGTATLAAAMSVNSAGQDFALTAGTLDLAGYNLTINDQFTIGAGGTLMLRGSETVKTPTISAGGTVVYTGTSSAYNLKNWSYSNLTIAGGANSTFSMPANMTTINNLVITSGNLYQAGYNLTAATFSNDGTLSLNGSETTTFTGGMDTDSGTVQYVGTSGPYTIKDFGANDYYNLVINGAATTFNNGANLDVNGAFTLTAGTFVQGAYTMNVAGNFGLASGTSFTKSSNSSALTFDGAGTLTDSTAALQDLGAVTIGGTTTTRTQGSNVKLSSLTINSGNTYSLNGYNLTRATSGAVSNSGTFRLQGGETLTNVTNLGTGAGTVEYTGDGDGIADTYTIKDFGGTDYYNLTINSTDGTLDTFAVGGALNFGAGGAFTMTNGTYDFGSQTITTSGDWTYTAGTINAGTSTIVFGNTGSVNRTITGNQSLYNITFDKPLSGNCCDYTQWTVASGNTLTANGTLTINNVDNASYSVILNTGTIAAKGDINITGGLSGTATILINGTGNQTMTGTATAYSDAMVTALNINKASGTLTLAGTIRTSSNWTYTAGALDAGTSTVIFDGAVATISGSHSLNNVTFTKPFSGNCCDNGTWTIAGGTTLTSLGTLTLTNLDNSGYSINTGTLSAQGNVVVTGTGIGGSAALQFTGTNNQSFDLTGATNLLDLNTTINKASGSVTLLSALTMDAAGQDLTITSGRFYTNGYNVSVNDLFTVGNGGTLAIQGGETFNKNPTLNTGSTMEYTGDGDGLADSYTIRDYGATDYYNLKIASLDGATDTFTVGSALKLTGALTHTAGTLSVGNNITTVGGAITSSAPIVLTANSTFDTTNSGGVAGGNITMSGTVNGAYNFTATGGALDFTGSTMGGTTPLAAVSLTGSGGVTLGSVTATSLFARALGASDMILGSGSRINTSGAGTNLTLVAGRNFINNSGTATPFNTGTGNWRVYSTNPSSDTLNGMTSDFRRFSCSYGGSCPAMGTGNGFLYSYTPTLNVTAATQNVTYGDANSAVDVSDYAYTVSGYLGSDAAADNVTGALQGSTNYAQGQNAGTTANINYLSGTLTSGMGYAFSYSSNAVAVNVNKAELIVAAANKNTTYGSNSLPTLTGSITGYVMGENATTAGVTGSASYSTTATAYNGTAGSGSNAGTYAITAGGNLNAANYSFTYVDGTLTVDKAVLTATANNQNRLYGDNNPTFTQTITGYVNGDTSAILTGSATASSTATNTSNVGTYTITGSTGTLGTTNSNYTFAAADGTLTIDKAHLTVTADNKGMTYGGNLLPSLTSTITGFKNGENATSAGVTGSASLSTTATAYNGAAGSGSNAGTYTITAAANNLNAANYDFNYANGTLTVNRAVLTASANNQTRLYGASNPTFTQTVTGYVNGDTSSILTGSATGSSAATSASNVGTYAINSDTGTLGTTNSNYNFVAGAAATLIINPALLSVTATNKTAVAGAVEPALTYTYIGLVAGDSSASFTGSLARAAGSSAGTYAITRNTLNATGNYTIDSFNNGVFTLTGAAVTRPALNTSILNTIIRASENPLENSGLPALDIINSMKPCRTGSKDKTC